MGQSSLVKAVHAEVAASLPGGDPARLILVEIHRDDIPSVPNLLAQLRAAACNCPVRDDLGLTGDAAYQSLKAVLDGGIEASRPMSSSPPRTGGI